MWANNNKCISTVDRGLLYIWKDSWGGLGLIDVGFICIIGKLIFGWPDVAYLIIFKDTRVICDYTPNYIKKWDVQFTGKIAIFWFFKWWSRS